MPRPAEWRGSFSEIARLDHSHTEAHDRSYAEPRRVRPQRYRRHRTTTRASPKAVGTEAIWVARPVLEPTTPERTLPLRALRQPGDQPGRNARSRSAVRSLSVLARQHLE